MIHLARRQRSPTDYDIAAVARATDGFSGADPEEVVINALFEAYDEKDRTLKTAHLLNAAREIIPLSRSRARQMETLRQWAATNCRMAAATESDEAAGEQDGLSSRRARLVDL
ncbi:hypothetical protein [Accumulibacter sp.]|uniref:hypothetical protein n=1 Tax=Accumulibacter sp. TaxID=2053492 RepID=UPI0025FD66FC|nr:hypothetical protein [Accumulibacter sp.]MCM8611557.1 hypothetical protein [Accumulibacter sp.]MCM8635191.1 hypothetical protein [Accumulibacter sp.]MCM8640463.1 hypothetical protein [Accumulibacter sp.]